MKTGKMAVFAATLLLVFTCAAVVRAQEADIEGSKDHPLLSRMKNFFIAEYLARYDEHEFTISDSETKVIEGDRTFIEYRLKEGSPQVSPLQIRRNYGNALKSLRATLILENESYA
ncbi:MAG: hypothetical protein ACYDH3_05135, partial [Candidatus Aminicenantales bacterium]